MGIIQWTKYIANSHYDEIPKMKNKPLLEMSISRKHKQAYRIWWNIKEEKEWKFYNNEEEEKILDK